MSDLLKYQSYPKSIKIVAIKQNICIGTTLIMIVKPKFDNG